MAQTFLGDWSAIDEDCLTVAYASDGLATSSIAWAPIELEPSGDGGAGGAEPPQRAEGVRSADRTDDDGLHVVVDGGTAPWKRRAASEGGGSVLKRAKCEHGRIQSQCKECGGSRICAHGRQKHQCKECGGSGICAHGRQKSKCLECGGSSF
jgi:hypothetical protein